MDLLRVYLYINVSVYLGIDAFLSMHLCIYAGGTGESNTEQTPGQETRCVRYTRPPNGGVVRGRIRVRQDWWIIF